MGKFPGYSKRGLGIPFGYVMNHCIVVHGYVHMYSQDLWDVYVKMFLVV